MAGSRTTAVSAPGKVFLAGGYIVLDRAYTALVFGLSARISVVAREIRTSEGVQLSEIVVESPQFRDAQWRYGYHLAEDNGGIKVTQLGNNISANPFVETTLSFALTYIARATHQRPAHSISPARFVVLADNEYYSQPSSSSPGPPADQDQQQPKGVPSRFARFPTTISGANKTGLGSSAALVTALTAALLSHYLPPELFDPSFTDPRSKRVLHNLAQAAHCAAQGKVGSGFDVATAVFGSCLYRRFSPSVLADLPAPGLPRFGPQLEALVGSLEEATDASSGSPDGSGRSFDGAGAGAPPLVTCWDATGDKAAAVLPPGLAIRMCDVDCGSQTVGMVKTVLKWRADHAAAAKALWDELQRRNEALAAVLRAADTRRIRPAVGAVREKLREMGQLSGVPIEPESQTALLFALEEGVEGVYGGVVPGAGGYDALALIMRDDDATAARVTSFLKSWADEKGASVRLLEVKGEMEGVRREGVDEYDEWLV